MGNTRIRMAAALAVPTLLLTACGGQSDSGTDTAASGGAAASGEVRVDGSSTVGPLTAAAGELFNATPRARASTSPSASPAPVAASRSSAPVRPTSPTPPGRSRTRRPPACADAGIEYAEIAVANDALTVVVNKENDWAKCLTVEELNKMWAPEAEGKITNWNQVRDGFPDVPLELFGAGTDSGTFDYFTDVDQR